MRVREDREKERKRERENERMRGEREIRIYLRRTYEKGRDAGG